MQWKTAISHSTESRVMLGSRLFFLACVFEDSFATPAARYYRTIQANPCCALANLLNVEETMELDRQRTVPQYERLYIRTQQTHHISIQEKSNEIQ